MKKYNEQEKANIRKALQVLKQTCKESEDCKFCPIGDANNHCMLDNYGDCPAEWEIEDGGVWRALR